MTEPKLSSDAARLYRAWIVPGLKQTHPPDVMRGEETQIIGWMSQQTVQFSNRQTAKFSLIRASDKIKLILPGTHSKWVTLSRQSGQKNSYAEAATAQNAASDNFWQIDNFTTYMTGELFQILIEHSLLKRSLNCGATEPSPLDQESFLRGIEMAQKKRTCGSLFGIAPGHF